MRTGAPLHRHPRDRLQNCSHPCTAPPPASSIRAYIALPPLRHRRPAHAHYVNTLGCFTAVIKEYPLANHYQTIQVPCVDLKINLISLYFALRVQTYVYINKYMLVCVYIYTHYGVYVILYYDSCVVCCVRAAEGRGIYAYII